MKQSKLGSRTKTNKNIKEKKFKYLDSKPDDFNPDSLKLISKSIGHGTYGVIHETNHSKYACKLVKIRHEERNDGLPIAFLREVSAIMALNDSPHVIKSTRISTNRKYVKIYMPKYQYNLAQYNTKYRESMNSETIKSFMFQILKGLYDAQSVLICHRDLKPENILINEDNKLVICDWGLSKFMEVDGGESYSGEVQSLWYRAPELLLGQQSYNSSIEIWSVGVIMCELYNGVTLLAGDCQIGQLYAIFELFGTPDTQIWPGIENLENYQLNFPKWSPRDLGKFIRGISNTGLDLISKMLKLNPKERISVVDALNHPYFSMMCNVPIPQHNLMQNLIQLNPNQINHQYMLTQENINIKMRSILIDWMIEVKQVWKLRHTTFFLACHYLDLYLTNNNIARHHLQLLGLACIAVASKVHEIQPRGMYDYIYMSADAYTMDNLLIMESELVDFFKYRLYQVTEYTFINIFTSQLNLSQEIKKKCIDDLYICITDLQLKKYKQYELVLGIFYIHLKIDNEKQILDYISSINLSNQRLIEIEKDINNLKDQRVSC